MDQDANESDLSSVAQASAIQEKGNLVGAELFNLLLLKSLM
jgi:hypothetical protein